MANITGNKGEWSEMYVLLRLLAQGKIHAANEEVQKIENIYFPILKIIREEIKQQKHEYVVDSKEEKINIYFNGKLINILKQKEFDDQATDLCLQIKRGTNRAFSIVQTERFMNKIGCNRLTAPSSDKTDITMQIHDIQTEFTPICGFSIKSELGNAPTLINATGATNFIYEVQGLSDKQINDINSIETKTKIKDRMSRIFSEAASVEFIKVNSEIFDRNLMMVDTRFPELVAYALVYHYRDGINDCNEILNNMEKYDPMRFKFTEFYKFKFKKFLCYSALGMTPNTVWDGIDEANGGYIIVTSSGDVLAYHIYNRNFFEEYLINQTRFERGSTTRHGFASLYKESGKTYMKLNLQVRFK